MARLFYWSLAGGAALVLLIATIFPLPQPERFRSRINVLPNGGRQEDFVIEWPRDRIEIPAGPDNRLVTAAGSTMLAGRDGPTASAEVFRLRDVTGNVIGLASRITSRAPHQDGRMVQGSDWVLLIPSRGALYLSQFNAVDLLPRPRASGDGSFTAAIDEPGSWTGTKQKRITAGPGPDGEGIIIRGTEEFAGLTGSYQEDWQAGDAAANGTTRGRITLSTHSETVH